MGTLTLIIVGGTLAIIGIAILEACEHLIDAYIAGHERVQQACDWLGLTGDDK